MSVATSYAKALYAAAKEAKSPSVEQLEKEMDSFAQALQQSEPLRKALLGPVVTAKEKVGIITALAEKGGMSKTLLQFLTLLANKERMPAFPAIRDAFHSVRLEAEGGAVGHLVSAEPMPESDVQGLAEAFGRKLGKRVSFRVTTDASLLAGMKVTVNGVTYDGTLRSQLQQLRDNLFAGNH